MRALAARLRERTGTRVRLEWRALAMLAALVVAGLALRGVLTYAWRPAFLGYPDSGTYLTIASNGPLFADSLRAVGYVVFLRGVHALVAHLTAVVVLQHLLGVASALLLFGTVRRIVGSPYASLVPAAVVLLGGTELFVEHAVLSESLFVFLQAAVLYATVRALESPRWWWALGAGILAGAATTVRAVGLYLVPLAVLALLVGRRDARLRRAAVAGAALAGSLALILAYSFAQSADAGYFGLMRAGQWDLYGRVAPFADCSRFTPPEGTRVLCERTPRPRRLGPEEYVFGPQSPAVRAYGEPFTSSQRDNDRVAAFAHAVILHQPFDYLGAVVSDLRRYVVPEGSGERMGDGLGPTGLVEGALLVRTPRATSPYWYGPQAFTIHHGPLDALASYERHTRVQGALFAILAVLALAAPFVARPGARVAAALVTLAAAAALVVPVATLYYDVRFAIAAFGVLAAAAAVGLHGAVTLLAPRARARSRRVSGAPSAAS